MVLRFQQSCNTNPLGEVGRVYNVEKKTRGDVFQDECRVGGDPLSIFVLFDDGDDAKSQKHQPANQLNPKSDIHAFG